MTIQLKVIEGNLFYPPDPRREYMPKQDLMLVHRYPEGDCDVFDWPLRDGDRKNLPKCLFDDRECGTIQDEEVLLPDGTSAWSVNEEK